MFYSMYKEVFNDLGLRVFLCFFGYQVYHMEAHCEIGVPMLAHVRTSAVLLWS